MGRGLSLDGSECVYHRLCTQPASAKRHFGSVLKDQGIANTSQKENYRLELPLYAARGRALFIPCLILPSQEPLCF